MIGHQLALIRREIWEHRAIYATPIVIAIVVTLLTLTGQVSISAFGDAVDLAIVGASNVDAVHRRMVLTGILSVVTSVFAFGAWIVTVFYSLDALYAERKDKSILFWRSLPITDAETVISKLLTAVVVIPLVTVAVIAVTHLLNLVFIGIWVSIKGGDAGHLVWGSAPLLDNWGAAFIVTLAGAVWMSPFIGWFMLVSALTKRMPLLMAFMPLIVIPLVEFIFLRTKVFATAVYSRQGSIPLFRDMDMESFFDEEKILLSDEAVSLIAKLDVVQFLTSPSMWAGLLVCGLLTTAAIYVRRYRDESY